MTRTANRPAGRRRSFGFSLIEMMVAASVSGVLASVAYPSFTGSVQKSRRSEALVALLDVQQMEERFRSNGNRYGSLAEIGVSASPLGGHYVLGVESPTAAGYVATAVARGTQARDAACRYMQVGAEDGGWTMRSGATAAADNDEAANRRCWNQ